MNALFKITYKNNISEILTSLHSSNYISIRLYELPTYFNITNQQAENIVKIAPYSFDERIDWLRIYGGENVPILDVSYLNNYLNRIDGGLALSDKINIEGYLSFNEPTYMNLSFLWSNTSNMNFINLNSLSYLKATQHQTFEGSSCSLNDINIIARQDFNGYSLCQDTIKVSELDGKDLNLRLPYNNYYKSVFLAR